MSLKDKLVSSFFAFEDYIDAESHIHDIRSHAIKNFEQKGFPTKKEESWKYTALNAILKEDYSIFPKKESSIEFKDVKKYFIHDIDTYKLVFIDGVYNSFLSDTTHDKYDICVLASAMNKPKYKTIVETYFNKVANSDSLSSLNTAF